MKKLIGLLAVSGMIFMSCGPSAEEKAAEEQRVQDSIAQVEAEAAAVAEAEAAALEAQRIQDSIAQAATVVEATATPAKVTTKTVVKEEPKVEPTTADKKAALKGAKKVQ